MRFRFAVRLAWREGRGALRKTGIHALAIAVGVGALVAVHGFRSDTERSVQAEARSLLGADARLSRRDPLPDSVRLLVDSLAVEGARVSTVVTVPSMVLAPGSGTARLFQVREVAGEWPFYGPVASRPAGTWPPGSRMGTWVDPAVLIQLGVEVGDTLRIGDLELGIVATMEGLPADFGFQTAVGPQVLVPEGTLDRAGLLGFGSLVRYETFLALDDERAPEAVRERYETLLRSSGTGYTTARRRAEGLSEGLDALSRYLGVVGLSALLLGGIGVASAVHVFVRSKLTSVAVLRCLGASRGLVLVAYLLQAAVVGAIGSLLGAGAGVALQTQLPRLLGDLLPLTIEAQISWGAVAIGLAVGFWTTVVFALGPLLRLRDVAPLRALRADFEHESARTHALVWATRALLVAAGVLLAIVEAPTVLQGLSVAVGLGAVVVLLWLMALATTRAVRLYAPSGLPFAVRQGVSNLFRPRNQTVSVVLALGFGVFVVSTVVEVERNLAAEFSLEEGKNAFNVLLFDIQTDQRVGVEDVVSRHADGPVSSTPIVPARIAAIDGRPVASLLADTAESAPARWALRREYRNTYRAELTDTEELVAGAWWEAENTSGLPRISMEADQAESLAVGLGSRITWESSGRRIETELTNLRVVDWARFAPNFYVVFEPGILEGAPHTWLTLAGVDSAEGRALLQRDVALAFRNVSVLDLARVQSVLDTVLDTGRRALSLLALFSALAGVAILAGAVAVTRSQRMREAALLKTLGARRATLLRMLLVEYAALGSLAAAGALVLAIAASWALVSLAFELPFRAHLGPALALTIGVTGVSVLAGLAGSRGLLSRPPLVVLRELGE